MPISTSKSLFVSLRFTLSPRVTECPYQLPSHCSSFSRFTLSTRVTECPYQLPSHCSSLIVLLSVTSHWMPISTSRSLFVSLSFYSQSASNWMPISTSRSLFVSLRFTLSPQVTECPYQLPSHCSSLYVLLSVHESLNAHINFPVIVVRLSLFYSQSTSHWMPISTSSHCSSLYVLLSVHKSLNAHINFPVIVCLYPFYSQSTSHWMPISTSRSLFVSLRFTPSPQVTECPYQLPSHYSSLYILLSIHKSLNTHINFPLIVRLSTFTLSPQVTECPYQLPSHCSSLYVLLSINKSLNGHINFPLIVRLSAFYSQSTSHWMPISTSRSLFVSLRFTLSPQFTECPYQLPGYCSSLSVLLSVHNSLNAHINFPVIVRLSLFYSQYTSHWMPIPTSQSFFVSTSYSQSTCHWMSISTSQSLFVSLRFTLSPQLSECPYQLPTHFSSLYVLLSVNMSLNAHINFPVISRLSTFYSQSTSHWMPISTSQSLFISLRFTLSP